MYDYSLHTIWSGTNNGSKGKTRCVGLHKQKRWPLAASCGGATRKTRSTGFLCCSGQSVINPASATEEPHVRKTRLGLGGGFTSGHAGVKRYILLSISLNYYVYYYNIVCAGEAVTLTRECAVSVSGCPRWKRWKRWIIIRGGE